LHKYLTPHDTPRRKTPHNRNNYPRDKLNYTLDMEIEEVLDSEFDKY